MRFITDLNRNGAGPKCRWYPRGNAKVIAGARYFPKLKIGIWAAVTWIDGETAVLNSATDGEVDPVIIGAARTLQTLNSAAHGIEISTSSQDLVDIMRGPRRYIIGEEPLEAECWQTIFGLAKRHFLKWEFQEFKYDDLLREDSPLVRAVLDARERKRRFEEATTSFLAVGA